MFKGPGPHVGAAAHDRLQGFGAARKVLDGEIEPFVPEVTELLRDGQR